MKRRVVITGLGAISPIGNNVESLWDNLINAQCGVETITNFDTDDLKVKVAAQISDFEPLDYLKKNEIRKNDRFTQFAIAAAAQAVDDSQIMGKVDPKRFGVYMGSGIGGIHTFVDQCKKIEAKGPRRVSPHFIPMLISNIAAGNIAIRYNAQGPCLPVVTACATATHSIGEAFRNIHHGYSDAIIAGGTEASINRLSIAGFSNAMALSHETDPLQASIPFDQRRNGFVMGEGAGALILEELENALKRGAKIYGEIVAYSNTCDAYHVTAPHPEAIGATRAIEETLDQALDTGINLSDSKIYLNAHGTSTPLNDKTETLAIKKAFQTDIDRVLVSSTKSMTGHMLGAAGAIEAIASLLALQTSIIPPTIGYREKDPDCDLDYVPNVSRNQKIDLALSTSLGFGGHNGCLGFKKYKGD